MVTGATVPIVTVAAVMVSVWVVNRSSAESVQVAGEPMLVALKLHEPTAVATVPSLVIT